MKAVCPPSWKDRRFKEGKPIPYKAVWNDAQFARVMNGLRALEMEERWFIFYEHPHVFFHRSWTGQPVYRLTIAQRSNGYEVIEALWSVNSATDASWDSFYQAKLLDFLVCNLLLGESKPIPLPPGTENQTPILRAAIQDTIAGTYRVQPHNAQLDRLKKPWWRFW
jgi:hypothetical protein